MRGSAALSVPGDGEAERRCCGRMCAQKAAVMGEHLTTPAKHDGSEAAGRCQRGAFLQPGVCQINRCWIGSAVRECRHAVPAIPVLWGSRPAPPGAATPLCPAVLGAAPAATASGNNISSRVCKSQHRVKQGQKGHAEVRRKLLPQGGVGCASAAPDRWLLSMRSYKPPCRRQRCSPGSQRSSGPGSPAHKPCPCCCPPQELSEGP